MLTVNDLTMRFGGLYAIRDLSVTVEKGAIHAIIGPNGAGKSTLFNCICRFYKPQSGKIRMGEADLLAAPRHGIARLGIARTFQNLELFNDLTVLENVRLGAFAREARDRVGARDSIDSAHETLAQLGLEGVAGERAADLDFGTQKLVELARALAGKPNLLLLDEPAAGLRNHAIKRLDEILVGLAKTGVTIILVEHVMALVMSVSHRITVLNFGQKIAEGTPAEVARNPDVVKAYLGTERTYA